MTGYWYVEPTTEVLVDLLADPADRVPVYPFAVALYGGSAYFGQWGDLASRERLQRDLQLDDERFAALFDVTHANPLNQAVLDAAGIHVEAPPALPVEFPDRPRVLSSPVPYRFRTPTTVRRRLEQVADPERRAQLLERATYGHAKTLQALATFLRERGFTCREQLDGFDLLATADGQACLFEVKTWRRENLARQARAALAQLLEYQYRNRDILPDDVSLYMVLDRQPPRDLWLWEFLAQECGIVTCWISDGVLKTWEGRLFE